MELPRRILVSHAPPEAYSPMTRAILAKLGYAIVMEEDFESLELPPERSRPDLRIVDERNLADIPEDDSPAIPLVVLTGRHGVVGADPRIVGAVKRPAGMHELYSISQQVLEDVPRSSLRVPTHLPARCNRNGLEWSGAVLSLSSNGCLLRSPEPVLLGSRIQLSFDLPKAGSLEFDAECAYQLVPDVGLVFHATTQATRGVVERYVEDALAVN